MVDEVDEWDREIRATKQRIRREEKAEELRKARRTPDEARADMERDLERDRVWREAVRNPRSTLRDLIEAAGD
jgi:hypothetical protein